MTQAAFDTLGAARRLQEEFDIPQQQAEGVALLINEVLKSQMVTRSDLAETMAELKTNIAGFKTELKAELDKSRKSLIKWMVVMQLVGTAITAMMIALLFQISR